MNNPFARHPEHDLVRYVDGELSAGRAAKVARHVDSCAACQGELQNLQSLLADCSRYQDVLEAQMPAAPQPWRDLSRDFSRIDRSLANASLLARLTRPLAHSGAPKWAFVVGLTVLIVLVSLNQLRQAPSVQAASILSRAVAVSQSQPRPAHRLRVRTSGREEFTRRAGIQPALLQVAEYQSVAALFEAAHYDWNDPLSARAFQQWRDRQPHKTDEVTEVSNPQLPSERLTQIRTVSAEGELAAASITLNAVDYVPVEERLEFRDRRWIEITELADTSTESAGGSVANHVEVPVRAAELPSRPAAFAPVASASISDELQVLSALSTIGADLGDPVEVALTGGKVTVTGGEGISPRRQNEIRATLASLPRVEVAFPPVRPASALPEVAATAAGSARAATSAMQTKLEKQLGGHAEFDRFSTNLLDLDDAAMQHVYALHRLAQKFPSDTEAQLSAQDLTVLHELSRKHTAELAGKVSSMERNLVPTLSVLGGTAASVHSAVAYTTLQPAADDVYRSARRVELLVSQLLGMTPATGAAGTLPSDLLAALNDLQANLDGCQKFLQAR